MSEIKIRLEAEYLGERYRVLVTSSETFNHNLIHAITKDMTHQLVRELELVIEGEKYKPKRTVTNKLSNLAQQYGGSNEL